MADGERQRVRYARVGPGDGTYKARRLELDAEIVAGNARRARRRSRCGVHRLRGRGAEPWEIVAAVGASYSRVRQIVREFDRSHSG